MTDDLQTLYRQRADRAHDLDVEEVLRSVLRRAEDERHRRRAAIATGGGVLAVAAAAAVVLALATGGDGSTGSSPAAAPRAAASSSAAQQRAADHAAAVARAAARSAAARAQIAALEQAAQEARATLQVAAPAPKSAPLSLGLVPDGFRFLASNDATSTYGPADAPDPSSSGSFVGKIAAMVSQPTAPDPRSDFPLTVGGHPARYTDSDGVAQVYLYLGDELQIDVQFWSDVKVTEAQALAIAGSVDIRDTTHVAVG